MKTTDGELFIRVSKVKLFTYDLPASFPSSAIFLVQKITFFFSN